jgi:hypothetical protein
MHNAYERQLRTYSQVHSSLERIRELRDGVHMADNA